MAGYAPWQAGAIQFAREATAGVLVPATQIWRGPYAPITDIRTRRRVNENVGLTNPTTRFYDSFLGARLVIPATPFTYEQGPNVFEGGLKAATPGAAAAYLREYTLPVDNSFNTLKTYSFEAGNDAIANAAAAMAFAFVEEFELSGTGGPEGDAWMISSTWRGARKIKQALTDSLTLPSVEEAMFNNTLFYVDNSGGTVGTTLVSDIMHAATIRVRTLWVPVPTPNGTKYYSKIKYVPAEGQVTFDITAELEDVTGFVNTEQGKYDTNAFRLLRFKVPGTTANKELTIDIAGRYTEDPEQHENMNGNTVVHLRGEAIVSTADALYFKIAVKNGLAALAA